MFYQDEEACCCGSDVECSDEACDCTQSDSCDCGCDCGDPAHGTGLITMTDTESGEEYTFMLADDFEFNDDHYCVLVTADTDQEPEMVITRVVKMDDGTEGLMSLDDEDYERVYAEYDRLCEEDADEEADDEEEG